jgi:glycosyltransferase involved in cell wall biosynthesis
MTSLSVVTITLNHAEGLERTLRSVSTQSLPPDELIIVDGMSDDSTPDVVRPFLRQHVEYLREPDRGVYDAMNKGWQRAKSSHVQFLNAGDTYSSPRAIETIMPHLRNLDRSGWLVVGAERPITNGSGGQGIGNLPHVWWRHALGLQSHCHQACFFSRDMLEVLGGLSEDFGFAGDFDFILRAGLISRPREHPEILIHYEGGGLSDQLSTQIPDLLHQVRTSRLGLTKVAAQVDWTWSRSRLARLAILRLRERIRLGAASHWSQDRLRSRRAKQNTRRLGGSL